MRHLGLAGPVRIGTGGRGARPAATADGWGKPITLRGPADIVDPWELMDEQLEPTGYRYKPFDVCLSNNGAGRSRS